MTRLALGNPIAILMVCIAVMVFAAVTTPFPFGRKTVGRVFIFSRSTLSLMPSSRVSSIVLPSASNP